MSVHEFVSPSSDDGQWIVGNRPLKVRRRTGKDGAWEGATLQPGESIPEAFTFPNDRQRCLVNTGRLLFSVHKAVAPELMREILGLVNKDKLHALLSRRLSRPQATLYGELHEAGLLEETKEGLVQTALCLLGAEAWPELPEPEVPPEPEPEPEPEAARVVDLTGQSLKMRDLLDQMSVDELCNQSREADGITDALKLLRLADDAWDRFEEIDRALLTDAILLATGYAELSPEAE